MAANITYFTMQVKAVGGKEARAMVVGIEPGAAGLPGQPGHLLAHGLLGLLRLLRLGEELGGAGRLGLILGAQQVDLIFQRLAPLAERRLLPLDLVLLGKRLRPLLGLLGDAGRAHEHSLAAQVGVDQLDPALGDAELADLVTMIHTAGFQDVQTAITLAVGLQVAQQDPGVHER